MNTRTLTGTPEFSGTTDMPVATQSTKRPDVRVVASDFDAKRPLFFCGLRAVPAAHAGTADARLLVFAHRNPLRLDKGVNPVALAEFMIRGSKVTVATLGEIDPHYLGSIRHLAKEVETVVQVTIREKRETIHAN